jgi:uncharacterized protein (TIGR02597 family)
MNKLRFSIFALCALCTIAQAQIYSPIVGFNTVTALGNSDTRFSVPLHRSPVYQGLVQSVSGNVITVQGLPGWTSNQFVYSSGSQTNTYYLSVGSGNKEGMYYTVTANSADSGTTNTSTLAVDTAGDTIDGGTGIANGASISIIPYWTFATLFPSQQGITTTSSISGAGLCTRIFIPDLSSAGVNLAASGQYYYYSGTGFGGEGWRKSSGGFSTIRNNDPVSPDVYLIIRQDGVATSSVITATGNVPSGDRRYIVGTISANTEQDNAVAVDIPVPLTLTQSNLFESGAFTGTASISGVGGDKLFVFNDATAAVNKAAFKQYYYYTGTGFGGSGWRLTGGGFSTIKNNEIVFQPGSGYVIRKVASPTPSTVVWTIPTSF